MTAKLVADVRRFFVPYEFAGEAHSQHRIIHNPNMLKILCVCTPELSTPLLGGVLIGSLLREALTPLKRPGCIV